MKFQLEDAIPVLERTPRVLDAWLRGLPDAWVKQNEGDDTWSPYDVVGHLIIGERTDWIPRARRILEQGEAQAFDKFDRYAHFEEGFRSSAGKSLDSLLDEFAVARAESLRQLHALHLALDKKGRHPELGPVTLRNLLATWVAHDLTHLSQICRVMAHQYREEVGPWVEYLGVLKNKHTSG